MNLTDKIRVANWTLFALAVIATVVAWFVFGKEPSSMVGILGVIAGGGAIGEFANVGKRLSYKRDHHEVPTVRISYYEEKHEDPTKN